MIERKKKLIFIVFDETESLKRVRRINAISDKQREKVKLP